MKYLVENYDTNQDLTLYETEHETLEDAKKEYEKRCTEYMEPADAKHTIIILSQIDDNDMYGSLYETHR